jgi:phage shock protein PspC (stress-responsive transcriptional regulator)
VRDLEQAIAEKFQRFLGAHKTVVTGMEVAQALDEMGPVEDAGESPGQEKSAAGPAAKKLYRIPNGAILAGVANGIATYFDIDVTLVRILFVLLTIFSGGAWVVVYIAMAIFVPRADTPEQISHARGAPFNAQEVMSRAHRLAEDIHTNAHHWKQEKREWRRQWREEKRRIKWEARQQYRWHHHHHSVIGELVQIAILVAIAWAVYAYIPSIHPFYQTVGADVQSGWAWLNAKVVR